MCNITHQSKYTICESEQMITVVYIIIIIIIIIFVIEN